MMNMKLMPSLILLSVLTFLSLHQRHGAYADSKCPSNCMPYLGVIHCNKTTGRCLEGCNKGFYGNTCDCRCHCGDGACVRADGTCMQTSSAKPVQGCSGHQTEDYRVDGYIAGISVLCVLVLSLIAVIGILVFKFKRLYQRSNKQQGEDVTLLSESSPSQPSGPVSQMTKSEKDKLFHNLGVLVLYHEDNPSEPIFLFCVHMKYDSSRVNTSNNHITEDRYLVNEKDSKSSKESSEGFKNFHGTTCLSPAYQGDCPSYWEVHCHVQLKRALISRTLLLCIGLCREGDRDVSIQIPSNPHCYELNVSFCEKHELICTKIYRQHDKDPSSDVPTGINSSSGGTLRYGILVYKGKNVIMFFDLMNKKRLCCLDNVNFGKPLWPMFGVFNIPHSCRVSMKLETNRYIEVTSEKKNMIQNALSCLK